MTVNPLNKLRAQLDEVVDMLEYSLRATIQNAPPNEWDVILTRSSVILPLFAIIRFRNQLADWADNKNT